MARSKALTPPVDKAVLEQFYQDVNRRAFGGVLPQSVPILYVRSTKFSGRANARVLRDPKAPSWDKYRNARLDHTSLSIEMTVDVARSENQFLGIFLHEMIHVYFYVMGDFKEDHGSKFLAKLAEVEKVTGHKIPVTEEIRPTDINLYNTEVGVILTNRQGRLLCAIVTAKTAREQINDIFDRLGGFGEKDIRVYLTNSPLVQQLSLKIKTQRGFGPKTKYYNLGAQSQEITTDLAQSGKLLRSSL